MTTTFFWVYILLCENNTYYTGYTDDLEKRFQAHVSGTGGCKYTRSFKPRCIAQAWKIKGEKRQAMQIERHIKSLSRTQKEYLINSPITLNQFNPGLLFSFLNTSASAGSVGTAESA